MKDAAIMCSSVLVGIRLLFLVIAILPLLIAMAFIVQMTE